MSRKSTMQFAVSSSMALATVLAMPAYAQDDVSGREYASASDIIVTARRVEESLQDVPISVTVFNQEQISNKGITNTNDLAIYTPSLGQSNVLGNLQATFSLRGFNQDLSTSATVGVFFADVVAPRGASNQQQVGDGAGPGSFFDLENVQILKGPQGTLFGRNTTGGAILIVPKKPTDSFEGYAQGGISNYDGYELQGVVNIPLADTFKVRLGVDRKKRDGYVKNLSDVGPDAFNDVNYTAFRLSAQMDLTPDLENYLIATYTHSKTAGEANNLFQAQVPPPLDLGGGFILPSAVQSPFGFLAQYVLDNRPADAGFFATENGLPNPRTELNEWRVINTTTWQASDNLTVKNIASYAELKYDLLNPVLGVAFPIAQLNPYLPIFLQGAPYTPFPEGTELPFTNSNPYVPGHTSHQWTFTEELQFQGVSANNRLTWQAGFYYEDSGPLSKAGSTSANLLILPDPTDPFTVANPFLGSGSIGYNHVKKDIRSIGIYGQASYDLTEQLKLTGGIRYTWDETNAESALRNWAVPYDPVNPVALYHVDPNSYTCLIPGAERAKNCIQNIAQKSEAPTWLLGLDYKPTSDILLYAKYARGYRTGGVSGQLPVEFQTYDEEKVDTYEVGAKTSFGGAVRGLFNIAAFYNDFRNQQVPVGFNPIVPGSAPNQTGVVNAGASRIWGIEADASIEPFDGFVLTGGYSYLNTRIKEINVPDFNNGVYVITTATAPAVGDALANTPKHKFSGTAAYTLPLNPDLGTLTVSGTYTYTDSRVSVYRERDANGKLAGFSLLDPYELVDFNLNWANVAGLPIDVSTYINNAFQEKYHTYHLDVGAGFQMAQLGRARTYGLRVKYHFGN